MATRMQEIAHTALCGKNTARTGVSRNKALFVITTRAKSQPRASSVGVAMRRCITVEH